VEFARNHGVRLHVRSAFTWEPGTWIEEEDPEVEQAMVSAVVSDSSEAKLTVTGVLDRPGIAAQLFRALADRSINVDMIEQNVSVSGTTDISFTVPHADLATAADVSRSLQPGIGASAVIADPDVATVSIIGAGMKTHPGVSATMFEVLAGEGINIEMISTSSIRLTCVIRAEVVERAVVALHRAFKLEGE
jgi:aspartate kinase